LALNLVEWADSGVPAFRFEKAFSKWHGFGEGDCPGSFDFARDFASGLTITHCGKIAAPGSDWTPRQR
jgi:hypothetical protein